MSVLANSAVISGAGGIDVGDIANSLRFRASASAYLSRTFGTPTSQHVFTLSMWVKRSAIGSYGALFGLSAEVSLIEFQNSASSDVLSVYQNGVNSGNTSASYRDPSSWLHIVYVSSASTSATLYVNNVSVKTYTTANRFNASGATHFIGARNGPAEYLDGYLSRVVFVDSQALTPSSFGYLSPVTNEWTTKTKAEIRTAVSAGGGTRNGWGTNGFMLNFENSTSLTTVGYDTSQSDASTTENNWTLNNFSLSYDSGSDQTTGMTPTITGAIWTGSGANTVDNNTSTTLQWNISRNGATSSNARWDIDLGSAKSIARWRIWNEGSTYNLPSWKLQYSTDGSSYTDVTTLSTAADTWTSYDLPAVVSARYWRILPGSNGADGNSFGFKEVELLTQGAASVTYDHMTDVPGNSFATLNPLALSPTNKHTIAYANLDLTGPSGGYMQGGVLGSTYVGSGKWYWESKISALQYSNGYVFFGIAPIDYIVPSGTDAYTTLPGKSGSYGGCISMEGSGVTNLFANNGTTNTNVNATFGAVVANDVIQIAFDADSGKVWFGKNNTWYNSGDPAAGTNASITLTLSGHTPFTSCNGAYTTGSTLSMNFGQRPFSYTPPTGFLALCQENLADIDTDLLDPTDHHIDIAVTKSGNTNFTLPWDGSVYDTFFEIKQRNGTGDWYQVDGLRGYDKILKSNSTAAETTDANVISVSGTTATLKSTLADGTYIVSCTKAGLTASRQTNTDGTITSTVSRNVDSGFAIVTYTGTGANATVGHGLGAVVKFQPVKCRNVAGHYWATWHYKLSLGNVLYLNTAQAETAGATVFNSTAPTSTVFSLGSSGDVNANTQTYVAYCYADSAIQKSFSYTGNGSTDGPYVDLGFKCGRWLGKRSDAAQDWLAIDSSRGVPNGNPAGGNASFYGWLYENSSASETYGDFDFTSNGFKPRTADTHYNASSGTYIGHAWAAVTGKYSLSR